MEKDRTYQLFGIGILLAILAILLAFLVAIWQRNQEAERMAKESAGIRYIELLETKDVGQVLAYMESIEESREAVEESIEQSIQASLEESLEQEEAESIRQSIEESESIRQSEEAKNKMDSWVSQLSSGKFVALTDQELNAYKKVFGNCVVFGDSMAQAVLEYGFLDTSHVVYKRSYTVDRLLEVADVVTGLYPEKIILFTGLNDCNKFALIEDYITHYEALLNRIRETLPNVEIYICSLLPPNDAIEAYRADLARSEFFDAALKEMCERRGDTYIDINWMVYQHLYLNDGIHFKEGFYSVWLQYVTEEISK